MMHIHVMCVNWNGACSCSMFIVMNGVQITKFLLQGRLKIVLFMGTHVSNLVCENAA